MTWARSSPTTYPSMMMARRNAGDAGFSAPQVIKTSSHPFCGINPNQWGAYATVWPDPADGSFWIANEWVKDYLGGNLSSVSTWWAQMSVPVYDLYVDKSSPSIVELGTLAYPYHTVTKAVQASTHGTLHIAGGHYNEALTISQAPTIISYSGSVIIGAP